MSDFFSALSVSSTIILIFCYTFTLCTAWTFVFEMRILAFFARCLIFTLLSHPQGGRNIFFISFLTHPFLLLLLHSNFSVIVVVANVTEDFAHILGAFVWFHRFFVLSFAFFSDQSIFFLYPRLMSKENRNANTFYIFSAVHARSTPKWIWGICFGAMYIRNEQ